MQTHALRQESVGYCMRQQRNTPDIPERSRWINVVR